MSCSHIRTTDRKYPLRQPADWIVKFPRYMLELPEDVNEVSITYIGLQPRHEESLARASHTDLHRHVTTAAQRHLAAKIDNWIGRASTSLAPALWEKLYVETGYDVPDTEMYILYWADKDVARRAIRDLDIKKLHNSLPSQDQQNIGIWHESFKVPKSRLETVYSGNDYQPGIASLPGAKQVSHAFTGYWGAARDRIPSSADDSFEPEASLPPPDFAKDIKRRDICGSNNTSMIHIRSGQYWERCEENEREAYERTLEPVLREGMAYLENNAAETGDCGLRFSRNLTTNRLLQDEENAKEFYSAVVDSAVDVRYGSDTTSAGASSTIETSNTGHGQDPNIIPNPQRPRRETCSSGFFRSLKDLENWAAKHPTHHKIFHGAHAHSTKFGKTTFKMRTWHEVAALKPGEVQFEYVNCQPWTGLLGFVEI
ncbi:hypothetical protein M409DRAFT_23110 [Zasmidium cellare ATCC 36951]|uniref:Phenylacetaldoxime dehydratase n=1 Tax=Zasmidium cellare ATCC 36951 TaxID=1080233 RepID=A0A6A6CHE3_ZASCE|nr:uncharacterized protein M409DRAFT_23110 [Zasmidium cellare ATCC 36951]KAF2166471.1 hypothetical protein M409DRAFT_23110 [Zasmidium cellare ATCC 36951]